MAIIPAYKVVNTHFSTPEGKIGLLYGERGVFATAILVSSEIIKRDNKVVFVDGSNKVDPYYLAKLARYRGIDPKIYLQRAFVSRAFTCYQLELTITEGLRLFMNEVGATTLILYGIIDQMDDEQVPKKDVFSIMRKIRDTLNILRSESISTLLVSRIPHFQLKERERLFESVKRMADVRYHLEQIEQYQRITIEGENNGTNNTDGNDAHPIRTAKLVQLPQGAQKRGSRYLR